MKPQAQETERDKVRRRLTAAVQRVLAVSLTYHCPYCGTRYKSTSHADDWHKCPNGHDMKPPMK